MRLSIAAVVAFATATLAQVEGFHVITKPARGEQVPAGSTYQIVWQPDAKHPGDITIGLLGGDTPTTLGIVETIAKDVDGQDGSYSWSVPASLGDLATYGIMITLQSNPSVFQYGFPFQIVAGDSDDEGDDEGDDVSTSSTATDTATVTETETEAETKPTATPTKKTSKSETEASTTSSSTNLSVPSTTLASSTISANESTTAVETTATTVVTDTPTSATSSDPVVITNGAVPKAAGGFAMLGGFAVAVLAL